MESSHELLTSQEVAACLRKSRSTIYRMTREGMLPAKKIGGTWRYSRQDIDAWLREQDWGIDSGSVKENTSASQPKLKSFDGD